MLARNWGWVVARGVAAVLFGVLMLAWPAASWLTLLALFAAFVFVDGVTAIVASISGARRGEPRWGSLLVSGVLSIIAAVLALMWPRAAVLAFVWMTAFWALFHGILELTAAIRLRKLIEHEWLLGLAGVLSIAFGLLLILRPAIGALTLIWTLGVFAILFGSTMIGVGLRLRSWWRGGERELPHGATSGAR